MFDKKTCMFVGQFFLVVVFYFIKNNKIKLKVKNEKKKKCKKL
jgi:hypothetical protein